MSIVKGETLKVKGLGVLGSPTLSVKRESDILRFTVSERVAFSSRSMLKMAVQQGRSE